MTPSIAASADQPKPKILACRRIQRSKPIRPKPPDHRRAPETPISPNRKSGCIPGHNARNRSNRNHQMTANRRKRRSVKIGNPGVPPEQPLKADPAETTRSPINRGNADRPRSKIPVCPRTQHRKPIGPKPESPQVSNPSHRQRNRAHHLAGSPGRHQANLSKYPERLEPRRRRQSPPRGPTPARSPPRSVRPRPPARHRATTRRRQSHPPNHEHQSGQARTRFDSRLEARPTTKPPSRARAGPAEPRRKTDRRGRVLHPAAPARDHKAGDVFIDHGFNPGRPSPPGCAASRRNHPAPSTTWR